MDTKELKEAQRQAEAEGALPGTPEFNIILDKKRVEKCQELRNVTDCRVCNYFEHCDLAKRHLIALGEIQRYAAIRARENEARKRAQVDALSRTRPTDPSSTGGEGAEIIPPSLDGTDNSG